MSHSISPQSGKTTDKSKLSEHRKIEKFNPLDIIAEHQKAIKEKESKLLEEQIQTNGYVIRKRRRKEEER